MTVDMKPKPTRDGWGNEMVVLGKTNPDILVMSADLEDATRGEFFKFEYPTRFISTGIAEQDLVGTAAGLASMGYIPVICSFAVFMTNRAYDQIRLDVCYNDHNVKIVCSHAGVTVGQDGASAQCLEDLAIMRVLPNMKVICPVDEVEARKATRAIVAQRGPMYLRTSRSPFPILTDEATPFEIGKAVVLRKGADATFIGCGILVSEALKGAEALAKEGIDLRVINMHTIKPIDKDAIITAAKETGAIVTGEEHQIYGGLGSAVAEVLAQNAPVPQEFIAVNDTFGKSGTPEELMEFFGLTEGHIIKAVKKVVARKKL